MRRSDAPLLLSKPVAAYELSLREEELETLVNSGELAAVVLHGRELVVYESLVALVSKLRRDAWRSKRGSR